MGYATDIFSPAPSASCICAVCHDVLKDAISLNCGHTFCASVRLFVLLVKVHIMCTKFLLSVPSFLFILLKQCIKSIIRNSWGRTDPATCPNCRVVVASSNPNYVVREIIDELQVHCPNSTECNWMGRVKDLQGHDNTCMYKVIECNVEGCTHTCERKDIDNHSSDMNVKLQHLELKYDKKLKDMETKYLRTMGQMEGQMEAKYEGKLEECEKKYDTKLKQMERKYKKKFSEYENTMQVYENRLQTLGGDASLAREKRKRSRPNSKTEKIPVQLDTVSFVPIRPAKMIVEGCGIDEINGVYSRVGYYDDVPKYVRTAQFRGRREVFNLYRYQETSWYISIVPGLVPGSARDIDFYTSICSESCPPRDGWQITSNGILPTPTVYPSN